MIFSDGLDMPQGRLKAGSAELERSCRRRRDAAGYCGGSAFIRTGRMFPFGKLLGLPFMRLSGSRADCLPAWFDSAAKCLFRRPRSMEAV